MATTHLHDKEINKKINATLRSQTGSINTYIN